MKRYAKSTNFLRVLGIFLVAMLGQTARAQSTVASGLSVLGPATPPVGGITAAPQEYVEVSWSVVLTGSIYTYNYQVVNPAGDVAEDNQGNLQPGDPETVTLFQVGFNTMASGALIPGSVSGGYVSTVNSGIGITWYLPFSPYSVAPGNVSGVLSFESYNAPVLGNASAQDGGPPSPWASASPNGQPVDVPDPIQGQTIVPEPSVTTLFGLAGLGLLPFRSIFRRKAAAKL
jgi:hypothetical protein